MQLGLRGPDRVVVTACASGNHGIGDAAAVIRRGAADVMLAGGTEAGVTPFCMAGLDATRALSRRNDDPERRQPALRRRPRRLRRGRGRRRGGAREPGARPRRAAPRSSASWRATGPAATPTTSPTPTRAAAGRWRRCGRRWTTAASTPEEVDYVNAHGTSTADGRPGRDRGHPPTGGRRPRPRGARVVDEVDARPRHGHRRRLRGRADGTGRSARARSRRRSTSTTSTRPARASTTSPTRRAPARCGAALSNSFGFGGHNAVLAFAAMEDG